MSAPGLVSDLSGSIRTIVVYARVEKRDATNSNAARALTLAAAGIRTGRVLVKAGASASGPWYVPKHGWISPRLQEACQSGRARSQKKGA